MLGNISTRQGSLSADDDGWHAVLLNNINGIYFLIPMKSGNSRTQWVHIIIRYRKVVVRI